ncbi:hypothetical protein SADUNF_Sadunf09G0002300 [Salix dunnii]|uniref:Uncharacterized protein n=1 Tax=Salix dunnii TaxID=1413687 RepID=A0A835JU56_9ROSI|nr:hypothetical protein SADUNF_Sadunf09G0002300 [Salix dunnii]
MISSQIPGNMYKMYVAVWSWSFRIVMPHVRSSLEPSRFTITYMKRLNEKTFKVDDLIKLVISEILISGVRKKFMEGVKRQVYCVMAIPDFLKIHTRLITQINHIFLHWTPPSLNFL